MRLFRSAGALALAGAAVVGVAGGASAATTATSTPPAAAPALSPSLTVRRVDTTAFPQVTIDALLVGATPATTYAVTENGAAVGALQAHPLSRTTRPVGTVLVIDTAASMNNQQKLAQVKTAALQYVSQRQPNEVIAVVQAGPVARVVANFTPDTGQLQNSVNQLGGVGEMALYDGVNAAAALFTDHPDYLANIVVVADRTDTLSRTSVTKARAAAGAAHATVFVLGISGDTNFSAAALQPLARDGGSYIAVQPSNVPAAFAAVQQALGGAVELSFTSRPTKVLDLGMTAAGLHANIHTVPGAVSNGTDATPAGVKLKTAPGPFKSSAGVALIALLALVAIGLFTYAVLALFTSERSALDQALQPYSGDEEARPEGDGGLVQTAIVARAVETTRRIAEERGLLERVETMLDQADLALRPAEAIFFYVVGVVVLVAAAFALKGALFGFIALVIIGLAPPATLSALANRRLKAFTSQLPDTLQLLASSLRAGFSFLQGVEAVANESPNPMGGELRRVLIEARLGRPVEEALQDCADRMKSADFDWAVMAVRIQREVGGNLAELLQTVGETMIERERLRRDVKSLTAEGRVSAIVLGILPPALGVLFYVTNPTYIKVLFTHVGGEIALGIATLAIVIGFYWMKKIVDIEV